MFLNFEAFVTDPLYAFQQYILLSRTKLYALMVPLIRLYGSFCCGQAYCGQSVRLSWPACAYYKPLLGWLLVSGAWC